MRAGGRRGLALGGALLGLSLLVGPPARAASRPGSDVPRVDAHAQSRRPDDVRRDRIARISAEIFELDAADLAERVASRRAEGLEEPLLAAIVLRAGRPIPPTLASARQAQREARAREALAWLAAEAAASPEGRTRVERAVARALAAPAGEPALPDLAIAAMEVAAALDMRDLAPLIAPMLGADRRPLLRESARLALFDLFGRWFSDPAAFAVFWGEASMLSPAALGRDELIRRADRADALFVSLVEARPAAVSRASLWGGRPGAAVAAAAALSRAIAAGAIAPGEARAMLRDGLEAELRTRPFHARLQVLLDLVQGADPAAAPARDLFDLVASLCDRPEDQSPGRAWVVIGGLPRLPYGVGAGADVARARALRRGTSMLRAVLGRPAHRPLDPDALQGAIGALVDLASAIEDGPLRGEASDTLVETLGRLVTTTSPISIGVRRAAASGLRLASRPRHAQMLLDIVQGLGEPALEYELIGALRSAIAVLPTDSDQVGVVFQRLFETASLPDFDARARALGVLVSDDVAKALAALDPEQRRVRAQWINARLQAEPSAACRRSLVVVLGRLDAPAPLMALLREPRSLALLALDGAESTEALGGAVRRTFGGDARALLDASSAVINAASGPGRFAGSVGGGQVERRSVRVSLLRLGASLGIEACASGDLELAPADHARILDAAVELLRVERALGRAAALDVHELDALLRNHVAPLETAGREAAPYALDRHVGRALLGARRITRAGAGETLEPGAVEAAFEAAIAAMPASPGTTYAGWTRFDLRVEFARFLRDLGRRGAALTRFDEALASLPAPEGPPALSVPVARDYVEMLLEAAGGDPSLLTESRALRALELLESVTSRAPAAGAEREFAWLQQAILARPGSPTAWGEGPRRVQDLLSEIAPDRLSALTAAVRALAPTDPPDSEPPGG